MHSRTGAVPLVSARSRRDIAAQALRVVHAFRPVLLLEPGRFPIEEFWDRGLQAYKLDGYVSDNLGPFVEGITYPDGRVELSADLFESLGRDDARSRFTVAHECGHGIMHVREIKDRLVSGRGVGLKRSQDVKIFRHPEWQADEFASYLLMPEAAVRSVINSFRAGDPSMPWGAWESDTDIVVSEIASVFGVSPAAARVRLGKLGKI